MFPLYKDRKTVKKMILKSVQILNKINIKKKKEIVIVDDGCPQNLEVTLKKSPLKIKT